MPTRAESSSSPAPTEGRWRVDDELHGEEQARWIIAELPSGEEHLVAVVHTTGAGIPPEARDANARLIAGSRQLLAAAAAARDFLSDAPNGDELAWQGLAEAIASCTVRS